MTAPVRGQGPVRILQSESLLREQAEQRDFPARVAVFVRAKVGAAQDLRAQLVDHIDAAIDRTAAAIAHVVRGASQDEHRAVKLFHADSLKLSELEVADLVREGSASPSVALAAAQRRRLSELVQHVLIQHCFGHERAMRALALNPSARPGLLVALVNHPDVDVRTGVATHIGKRLQVVEEAFKNEKQTLYNALVNTYEPRFANALIPVCRDPAQLQRMFDKTPFSTSTLQLFVDNPYSPPEVLEAIIEQSNLHPRFGESLARDAQTLLRKQERDPAATVLEP